MPTGPVEGRLLLTGATGFAGPAMAACLRDAVGDGLVLASRAKPLQAQTGGFHDRWHAIGDMGEVVDWRIALDGVSVVVHAAGRAHVTDRSLAAETEAFQRVNVQATRHLAQQAAQAGVRRFIFISSIKVNGERTGDLPFTAGDVPAPQGPYAQSKWDAERALQQICEHTGMEWVVVRPPLVYGPGLKGNLRSLARAVSRGWPLPLGSIDNRRSLIGLGNLADLVTQCVLHPDAAGRAFLASDGDDMSSAELVRRLAHAIGQPARLMPVPRWILDAAGRLTGRADAVARLCDDLRVDASATRKILEWSPPFSVDEEMKKLAMEFRK